MRRAVRGAGFRQQLAGNPRLRELDLRGTLAVPEGRAGTDFAAAGVGARFHLSLVANTYRHCLNEVRLQGPSAHSVLEALEQVARVAVEGLLTASIFDEVWGLLRAVRVDNVSPNGLRVAHRAACRQLMAYSHSRRESSMADVRSTPTNRPSRATKTSDLQE